MSERGTRLLVVIVCLLVVGLYIGAVIIKDRMPETTNYIVITYETHYPNAIDTKTISYVVTKDAMKNGVKPFVTSRRGTDILKITGGMTLVRSSAPLRVVSYKYKTVTTPGRAKKK